jgi:Uri superfamily endonuclease
MMLLKTKPGTYALLLQHFEEHTVQVGRLGQIFLRPGFYVYVGSALGPGGLPGRLKHHMSSTTQPHWHIDYLRRQISLVEVWYRYGRTRREHMWAGLLNNVDGASVPLRRFGASDCTCESHLFYFANRPDLDLLPASSLAIQTKPDGTTAVDCTAQHLLLM